MVNERHSVELVLRSIIPQDSHYRKRKLNHIKSTVRGCP